MTGQLMRELILGATGFAVGAFLHLTYRAARLAIRGPKETRSGYAALAVGRFAIIPPLLLVAELVYKALVIPPTWRAIVYAVSLLLTAGGYAWAIHKHVVVG